MTPKVGIERNNHLVFFRYIKERDEWVAELRVASRVVPLEDSFEIKSLLRKRLRPSISVQQETGSIEIVFWTPVSSPFVYG